MTHKTTRQEIERLSLMQGSLLGIFVEMCKDRMHHAEYSGKLTAVEHDNASDTWMIGFTLPTPDVFDGCEPCDGTWGVTTEDLRALENGDELYLENGEVEFWIHID